MCPKNYMNLPFMLCKKLGGTFVRFVTIHACDGQTDGQTDTFAVGKTALHVCSAVKTIRPITVFRPGKYFNPIQQYSL